MVTSERGGIGDVSGPLSSAAAHNEALPNNCKKKTIKVTTELNQQ